MHKLGVIVSGQPRCPVPRAYTFDDKIIKRLVVSKREQDVVTDSGGQNP